VCFSDILDSDTEKGDEPAKCPQDGDDTQDETLMTENDVRLLSVFHTCSRGLRVTNKRGGLAEIAGGGRCRCAMRAIKLSAHNCRVLVCNTQQDSAIDFEPVEPAGVDPTAAGNVGLTGKAECGVDPFLCATESLTCLLKV